MKKAYIAAIGAAVAITVGAITWHQLTKPSIENDEVAYYIAAAQPLYSSLPRLTVDRSLNGSQLFAEELYSAFSSAEVVGARQSDDDGYEILYPPELSEASRPSTNRISAQMHDQLLREASAILSTRFAAIHPEQYIEHRARQDAILSRHRFDKHFPHMFDAVAKRILGTEDVADASPETIFRTAFERHVPNALATGAGMAVAYGVDSPTLVRADLSEAALGYTGWSGGLSLGFAPMTTQSFTRAELLEQFGALPCAYVGVVMYYADRSPRPLVLWFDWHPIAEQWVLMRVMLVNFAHSEAMASMYPEF